jgi:hypothetical protein
MLTRAPDFHIELIEAVADERDRKVWMKGLITVCGKLKDGTMVMVFDEEGMCVRIWTQGRLMRKDKGEEEEEEEEEWNGIGEGFVEWPNAQQTKTVWSNDAPRNQQWRQSLMDAGQKGEWIWETGTGSTGQIIGILLLIVNQEVAAEKIAGTGLLWLGDADYLSSFRARG